MMDTPDEKLEINARKIKRRHLADVMRAAEQGTLRAGCPLSIMLLRIRARCQCDTTEIESINSLIGFIGARAPNISLELLSSRVTIKKAVALGLVWGNLSVWAAFSI